MQSKTHGRCGRKTPNRARMKARFPELQQYKHSDADSLAHSQHADISVKRCASNHVAYLLLVFPDLLCFSLHSLPKGDFTQKWETPFMLYMLPYFSLCTSASGGSRFLCCPPTPHPCQMFTAVKSFTNHQCLLSFTS